ncbi:hypothetical protein LCGC14_2468310 [marine sediment metagenome]|uniref:PilZ domain-containing protein n=1 Tax=marine sediment metagenome TaxID=412755 RepID=A0A0F9DN84_9ZZZZ
MSDQVKESRVHDRHELACPVVVVDADGRELFRAKTVNVSDGGVLLEPTGDVLPAGHSVHLNIRIPRETLNTFMYEDFFSQASVVRCQSGEDGPFSIAMKFNDPLKLDLDV